VIKSEPYVYLGFTFAVLAGFCFTSSNVMVKYLPDVNSWQLLFVRCALQIVTMIPIMIASKSCPFGTPDFATRWRIAAQGVLGGFLLLAIYQAVGSLPLGDATAIFFSSPAFTMILSFFILRDHCGFLRVLISVTLLGGVVLLSRPPSIFPPPPLSPSANASNYSNHHHHHQPDQYMGEYDLVGITAAFMVPLLSAVIVIITRQAKHVHYSVLVFWFAVGGQVVSVVGIYCFEENPVLFQGWEAREWALSVTMALVGIVGNILMTKAVFWVTPSKVMVVRSFEVLCAYVLQVTLFDSPTHLTDMFGTILIITAVLFMGVEDTLMSRLGWRFL